MKNVFDDFKKRGLVYDSTEGVEKMLADEKVSVYIGFDPTGDSLHVGSLVPMVQLARFQRFGHHPIALAGGGTGMVGDPSGRSSERNLLTTEQVAHNVECIKVQLANVLDFEVKTNPARMVNNMDWLGQMSMIDYLRDIGKHFTVQYMMGKESVKNRLGREDGLSYTEFSYMLMQAIDFLHLHDNYGVMLQCGGSDQWGNITAGTRLIRKVRESKAGALSYPLITREDGTKFGKTADGESVWLDPKKTSPYRFYQWFYNQPDSGVMEMLNYYTFFTDEEMADLAHQTETEPHRRGAQRALARSVTKMVHGQGGVDSAERASSVLFGGSLDEVTSDEIADIFAEVPSHSVSKHDLEEGIAIADILAESTLATSKGDARRNIKGGSMNMNNVRVTDEGVTVSLDDAIDGQFIILRKGKRSYHLVRVES